MGKPLRILMTNAFVASRSGSELYVRDVALALQARGYQPIIFSTRLGELAEELRRRSIMVTDDLSTISALPDLIHGQHHLETMAALLHFPNVPCLSVIHGWLPWQEIPVHLPRVRHYVAVSQTVYDSLTSERGISPEQITILPNFVDLDRFQARIVPLPAQPRRAAIFSGALGRPETFAIVQEACQQRGISLDAFGIQAGNILTDPEKALASYDIVFSIGRAAIECIALGAAVIVARPSGIAGQVTRTNYEALRRLNFDFGAEAPPQPLTVESVGAALDAYDPIEAQEVSQRLRAEADIRQAVDRLTALYDQVVQDWTTQAPMDPLVEMRLTSAYLTWFTSHYAESYVQQIGRLEHESMARHQLLEQAKLYIAKIEQEAEGRAQEITEAKDYMRRIEHESFERAKVIESLQNHIRGLERALEERLAATDNTQALVHDMATQINQLQEKLAAAEQREQAHTAELAAQQEAFAAQQQALIKQHQAEQEALESRLAEAQTAIDRLQRKLAYYRDLV